MDFLQKIKNINYTSAIRKTRFSPNRFAHKQPNLVVSLTSYGTRIKTCHLAIRSILMQSVIPEKILLYIGEESKNIVLPKQLLELQSYGLKIVTGVPNFKGHKKYFFSMQEFPDSIIVTIDDDCIYFPDTIENLLKMYSVFPDSVIACRVNRIEASNNSVLPYAQWIFGDTETAQVPRNDLLAVGVGGVLYPPFFASNDLFNIEAIKCFALNTDDIWLKFYELRHNFKVCWTSSSNSHPHVISETRENGLFVHNADGGGNDESIKMLESYFDMNLVTYIKDE